MGSFHGTRDKRGLGDVDWGVVLRAVALTVVLSVVLAPLSLVLPVRHGYMITGPAILGGIYTGARSDNWGDEYIDGILAGLLGSLTAGLLIAAAQIGVVAYAGGTIDDILQVAGLAVGSLAIVIWPSFFGSALAAYLTARQVRPAA